MLFASASTCVSSKKKGSKGGTWILIGVYSSQQPQPIISEKLGNVWAFTSSNLAQLLNKLNVKVNAMKQSNTAKVEITLCLKDRHGSSWLARDHEALPRPRLEAERAHFGEHTS